MRICLRAFIRNVFQFARNEMTNECPNMYRGSNCETKIEGNFSDKRGERVENAWHELCLSSGLGKSATPCDTKQTETMQFKC